MNSDSHRSGAPFRSLFLELVVIIAGVLIALAIDAWWAHVEESDRADAYTNQLIADMQATGEEFVRVAPAGIAATNAAKSLLAIFEENTSSDPKQVYELLNAMDDYDNPVPVLGTIEALISTGDLRIVRDANLRVRITGYYSYVHDYWLVPLYQWENNHRDLSIRIRVLAAKYGVSPRGIARWSSDSESADVSGFIGDDEAYAVLDEILQLKDLFARYSNAVSSKSSELKTLLSESKGAD